MLAATKSAVEVGGVEEDAGEAALLSMPVQEGLLLDDDFGADAAHQEFGDAALDARIRHQRIHLTG